ncbi:hypothetical protein L228DRAFT_285742 [Xylona heveae TC161]|uniref:Ubiquitin-protein ligase-like protein n=1 Tax=Xylona heveae (strain CBS 132557 / TC161) TaxID=1328760 RepID=A0A164ZNJ5_XYLHT|nr:hypothetical protein L228DRAFT_285742 [Xylona heveae TC161]KZF19312.1 hypothetical protein L228DRAFT_285742 [Xylona heveae TC161]
MSLTESAGSGAVFSAGLPVEQTAVPGLTSTFQQLTASAANATYNLTPSPKDLLMVVPRIIRRVGSLAFANTVDQIDNVIGGGYGGSVIAEATAQGGALAGAAAAEPAAAFAQGSATVGMNAAAAEGAASVNASHLFGFQNVRNIGGLVAYMTSKWALACITMAIILNRTQIYAAARRRIRLHWHLRLALRIIPITLFALQTLRMLQALRCQTSPEFPSLRFATGIKKPLLDFGPPGGLFYRLSSSILFWQDDTESCVAADMIQPRRLFPLLHGSLSRLWPLFQTLFLSQFIETLSCALQGRQPMAETGMTLFEHSLAFSEAETMVHSQLDWGLSKAGGEIASNMTTTLSAAASAAAAAAAADDEGTITVPRSIIIDALNAPPEMLFIAIVSSMNHLTSHILAVFGLQSRFRLINTATWGFCFMASFLWSFFTFSPRPGGDLGILRFPSVCVIGFIPHILILAGILICGAIYMLALILTTLALPPGHVPTRSWKERFIIAHETLLANHQLSSIRISMSEDFYTTLLKIGFAALTAASEAVFLNEGRRVAVRRWTWLEEERMKELDRARFIGLNVPSELAETLGNYSVLDGVGMTDNSAISQDSRLVHSTSGYARERSAKGQKDKSKTGRAALRNDGVGALQRGARWIMAWEYLRGIFQLLSSWSAVFLLTMLAKLGVTRRPRWLQILAVRRHGSGKDRRRRSGRNSPQSLEFWILSANGELSLPTNRDVDVETEMRRMRQFGSEYWTDADEERLDSSLYGWWAHGGWWGDRDESGEYQADDDEDDTTSVISMATTHDDHHDRDEHAWETDDGSDSGRRTPTQSDPFPDADEYTHSRSLTHTRESSPMVDTTLDPAYLARLLDPSNPEQRQEARLLSHHLASPGILTRSQYRRAQEAQRTQILTSTRYRPVGSTVPVNRTLTPEEEAELLEQIILARRSHLRSRNTAQEWEQAWQNTDSGNDASAQDPLTWKQGGEGLGSGGPQCVVCQCSPRTILIWPCRCLSLCEDCRISLAMNNFATCVCCRREVVGFSRIYVP